MRDPALQSPVAFLSRKKTGAETLPHSRPVKTSEEVLLDERQSIRRNACDNLKTRAVPPSSTALTKPEGFYI